jgi:hypothetical protein
MKLVTGCANALTAVPEAQKWRIVFWSMWHGRANAHTAVLDSEINFRQFQLFGFLHLMATYIIYIILNYLLAYIYQKKNIS